MSRLQLELQERRAAREYIGALKMAQLVDHLAEVHGNALPTLREACIEADREARAAYWTTSDDPAMQQCAWRASYGVELQRAVNELSRNHTPSLTLASLIPLNHHAVMEMHAAYSNLLLVYVSEQDLWDKRIKGN